MSEVTIKSIVHVMPESASILQRMQSVDDTGGDIERFQKRFAQQVGGQKINQMGLVMKWEMLAVELAQQPMATPLIYQLINLNFEEMIQAIFIESPDFAAACIEWRSYVENHE